MFTKLAELITIDDETKRAFYEFECIRGNWSVRELKSQIGQEAEFRTDLMRIKTEYKRKRNFIKYVERRTWGK